MSKSTVILSFLYSLYSCAVLGQSTFQGRVYDDTTRIGLPESEIIVHGEFYKTDKDGAFSIVNLPQGELHVIVFHEQYHTLDTVIQLQNGHNVFEFVLHPFTYQLSEIQVLSRRKELFALRKLRDVEGTTVNAGKKTEVVVMDNVLGNLAINQSRQIYAQVAGLNIYEGSDGGLQLAIGGRGLDPNRTANFNTRQNAIDISADVLGYPESYYTPPGHAIEEIQIIRGASSLQYGTQFGGLINFKIRTLEPKKIFAVKSAQTIGSFGLFDTYNQLTLKKGDWLINTYYNHKTGDGYRDHSNFKVHNVYTEVQYTLSKKAIIKGSFTYYTYLAKQAGGLTDQQFKINSRQSTRDRNWFDIDWKLYGLRYEQTVSNDTRWSIQLFGLSAERNAVGFRGNPNNLNENPILALDEKDRAGNYLHPRDLLLGSFQNYGVEFRWLQHLSLYHKKVVLLSGLKWYDANNEAIQGPGSTGSHADFELRTSDFPDYPAQSTFRFPNHNLALFAEGVFYLSKQWSLTPGLRLEYIRTGASGMYSQVVFDNAGNPIANNQFQENRLLPRSFLLLGFGLDYKPNATINFFANLSQNYRSVTFSDIRVVSPTFIIDPNIADERGLTFDAGIRGRNRKLSFNTGLFGVLYQDRIGIIFDDRANRVRKNIGDALTIGIEAFVDTDLLSIFEKTNAHFQVKPFANVAYTQAEYIRSENQNVEGKQVEFVPRWNVKTGIAIRYKKVQARFQYTYLSEQYTDAQNSPAAQAGDLRSGIIGEIPAYGVADLSIETKVKNLAISAGINNVFDRRYYTRRATGYPGPGIIPSDGISAYAGITFSFTQ